MKTKNVQAREWAGVVTVTFGPDTWRSQNTVLLLTIDEARELLEELECELNEHVCDDDCRSNGCSERFK